MRSIVISGLMLTLLLVSMLFVVFDAQVVVASGTIYIRADGSIDPPTTPISSADNITYTFVGNISDSIVVERDSIVIEGAGYTLQGAGSGYGIDLSSRTNVTIKNINITSFSYGIFLDGLSTRNNIVENNITANKWDGILLDHSSANIISGNNVTANGRHGIDVELFSKNNNITENHATLNGRCGIHLGVGSNSKLRNNKMSNNRYNLGVSGYLAGHPHNVSLFVNDVDTSNTVDGKPVYYWINETDKIVPIDAGYVVLVNSTRIIAQNLNLSRNLHGILLAYTTNSTIVNNSMKYCWAGINLYESSYNSILENNSTNNEDYGILLEYSSDNSIYHNNFIDNPRQGRNTASMNLWDNGTEGNYWSDYKEKYPNATEIDSTGIWNTPYVIDSENIDRYPLVNPWTPPIHDIAVSNVVSSKTVVGQGYSLNINVTAANQGDFPEFLNVTLYANTTAVAKFTSKTLLAGASVTIPLVWNTTGFAKGNYTISANATAVLGETDKTDNTKIDGWVIVAMVGDISSDIPGVPDGKVDMVDMWEVSRRFGINYPDPRFVPNYDVDGDYKIDMVDMWIVSKEFGKIDP